MRQEPAIRRRLIDDEHTALERRQIACMLTDILAIGDHLWHQRGRIDLLGEANPDLVVRALDVPAVHDDAVDGEGAALSPRQHDLAFRAGMDVPAVDGGDTAGGDVPRADQVPAGAARRMLHEHLDRVLARARERKKMMALLFLDLDRFKRVNDTLGHGIGDELLKALAERLMLQVRQSDYVGRSESEAAATISRLGGDEFTVVLSELRDAEDAAHVARRILEGLSKPFLLQGHELVMSASIGIAVYPTDGTDADTLLREADTAMYHAKTRGRAIYQFFTESMNTKAMRNLKLESALREAVDRDELFLRVRYTF